MQPLVPTWQNFIKDLLDPGAQKREQDPDIGQRLFTKSEMDLGTTQETAIRYSSWDHTAKDRQVCSRPSTNPRSETGSHRVYKWTDEKGQTQFSDTRPPGRVASVIDLSGKKRDFTYEVVPDGITLPVDFQGKVRAGAKRIYDTWHFFLREENLRQSHITLRVIGGPERFDAFRARSWPNSKPVSGFYNPGLNQAFVKYNPARPDQALATSFHEISHLITASHLGPTPPWLTEGLAEYFETMRVKDQAGTIYPNRAHINLLKRSVLPPLGDYLEINRSEWNGDQRDLNYATAWSLTHYLMSTNHGTYALQQVVQQSHRNFCKPFSAAGALDGAYPGGIPKLEVDLRKAIKNEAFPILQK